jgi:polysaccharide export outer membrane protein
MFGKLAPGGIAVGLKSAFHVLRQIGDKFMYRVIRKGLAFLCLAALPGGVFQLTAAEVEKTNKQLVEYIRNAQKLGLKEAEIKQNAVKAGWDKQAVEQAFTIVKYLNTSGKPEAAPATGATTGQQSLVAGGPVLSDSPALPGGYRVGPGDQIGIIVWKEPDASAPDTMVRADGKVTLPLVKEISVAGYTPTELEAFLAEKYSAFINGADVTVIVKTINSRKVYMIGALKKEGALPLLGPMTVLQAITECGGLNDYAKARKIYVLRTEKGKQLRLPFDYSAALMGEHPEQNILLQPNDSVIVPH